MFVFAREEFAGKTILTIAHRKYTRNPHHKMIPREISDILLVLPGLNTIIDYDQIVVVSNARPGSICLAVSGG